MLYSIYIKIQTIWEKKKKLRKVKHTLNYLILSLKEKVLLLNLRKRVKWAIEFLLGF